ncbi:MAG: damage-control phosphatase ARMT1 family protein [Anaerolineales bacterium]
MFDQSLPPCLMTSDPGSFARNTILERKPQIIRQVLADNDYPPSVFTALEAFRAEIASRPIQPLLESAPDVPDWNRAQAHYAGKTWLEIPWYFAESYFYRRLLEAIGYFQPGEGQGRDPFGQPKALQLAGDVQRLSSNWEQFVTLETGARFEALLHSSLWGNRSDLSNFTVQVKARSGLAAAAERHMILIDHTRQIQDLLAGGLTRVDFICDNVGSDLLFDLALADFLLCQGWVQAIHLNLKKQPFFVSDAMPADAHSTIDLLKAAPASGSQALGTRLDEDLSSGRLFFDNDSFWTTWRMFRDMPTHLRQELASAGLVLVKGDVNYRRLLDDRHWPSTTRMEAVCAYFPAPFVALRTLKGEIMAGLQPGQAQTLQMEDPTWLINGKRGVIQLVLPTGTPGDSYPASRNS